MTGPRRQAGGRWPLAITAVASVLAAVAMHVLAGERPSHTAAVATIVAVVVAVLRLTVASPPARVTCVKHASETSSR